MRVILFLSIYADMVTFVMMEDKYGITTEINPVASSLYSSHGLGELLLIKGVFLVSLLILLSIRALIEKYPKFVYRTAYALSVYGLIGAASNIRVLL